MYPRPSKWAFMTASRASGGISFLRGADGRVEGPGLRVVEADGEAVWSASGSDWQAEAMIIPIAVVRATARRRVIRGGIVTLLR
jgi:hypothetical protein